MKSKNYALLCLFVIAAIGLFIESSVWSPQVLQGKELLNAGGSCTGFKKQTSTSCPSNCTEKTRYKCSTGTQYQGCDTISTSVCGQYKQTGETCMVMTAISCEPCG